MSDPLRIDDEIGCGLVIPGGDRARVLEMARRIESAGFDAAWVGDHISFHIPILESLTLLSFVAAATERIKLGTSVYLLPLRHPTTTAKVASTVDVLSGGRLVMGVGVGGEFPPEFEASGVPVKQRGARTDEAIEILRRLWSEDGVVHAGKHFQFGPVSLDPKPLQPGGPPLWVGGRREPAFRRAGRTGDGYISHMCSTEMFEANLEAIRGFAREAGREQAPFSTASFLFVLLDDTFEAAHERASQMLGTIYNRDFREASKKYCLLGRPEDCLEQIRAFVRAGSRHIILSSLGDPDRILEESERAILPELKGLAP